MAGIFGVIGTDTLGGIVFRLVAFRGEGGEMTIEERVKLILEETRAVKDRFNIPEVLVKHLKQARSEALEDVEKATENVKSIKFSGWTPKHKYGREEASDEILEEIRALKSHDN